MSVFLDSELIINDGRIYHLNLKPEDICRDVILVGDPLRVKVIAEKLDEIHFFRKNREFYSCKGSFNNKEILIISSGIGTDNIDIVINELDALANINFSTRKVCLKKKSLNIYRLGTSGGIQKYDDEIVVSQYSIGLDGLAYYYESEDFLNTQIAEKFRSNINWPDVFSLPYCVSCDNDLIKKFSSFKAGITITATGFYAPQGRNLRLNSSIKDLHKKLEKFEFDNLKILNFEMESSAIYFLSKMLGHKPITICSVLSNRNIKTFKKDPKKIIDKMIESSLSIISK
ncbi:MAG: phosphorylase [Flavobacteriales bacterium TMED84]|nr:MAG: phosphorylase [Flavobacteriales bacterium TMED84]|tara:strand:+ start:206 stop:1063 length:858 start_codon:yes stop_codon:yes gene_type:complete